LASPQETLLAQEQQMRYSDFSTISLQLCYIIVIFLVGFGVWLASHLEHITRQLGDIKIKSHHSGMRTVRDLFALAHIHHVRILTTKSRFSDCYDTEQKTIYLSPETAAHSTITAIGIVAHEVGHALQDKNHFWLISAIANIIWLNRLAGSLTIPVLLTGFLLDLMLPILFGYCLFFISTICNILIYYLNSDASKRGEAWLRRGKLISKEEDRLVRRFLTSTNMSYLGGIVISPIEIFFTLGRMINKLTFIRSK
jgi:Zn-dependent membrane protease YugP